MQNNSKRYLLYKCYYIHYTAISKKNYQKTTKKNILLNY